MTKCLFLCGAFFPGQKQTQTCTLCSQHTCTQTQLHAHTSSSHLQPREVMKTNGRVLFPLGPEEELSHQANFILVWPRDSISSGCFYKCRAAPRHRPVMDMRAWWPDGRCWPCNSSLKHSLMTPLAPRASLPHSMKRRCLEVHTQTCAFQTNCSFVFSRALWPITQKIIIKKSANFFDPIVASRAHPCWRLQNF